MVSFDLLGPLPTTARGNEYVFLVVDLFSRHAEAYAITKGDKNTEGYAARLVNDSLHRVGDARLCKRNNIHVALNHKELVNLPQRLARLV